MDLLKSPKWINRWDSIDKEISKSKPSTKKLLSLIKRLQQSQISPKIVEFGCGELVDFDKQVASKIEYEPQTKEFLDILRMRIADPLWSIYTTLTNDFLELNYRLIDNMRYVKHGKELLEQLPNSNEMHLTMYGYNCLSLYMSWEMRRKTMLESFPIYGEYVLRHLPNTLDGCQFDLSYKKNRDKHLEHICNNNNNLSIGNDIMVALKMEKLKIEETVQRADAYAEALVNADIDISGERPDGIAAGRVYDWLDDAHYYLKELAPQLESVNNIIELSEIYIHKRIKKFV